MLKIAVLASSVLPVVLCLHSTIGFALSVPIGRDINFPKGYDPQKAQAIRQVIQDKQFTFVDGLVSEWPPDYGTRLSFTGDADALNRFVTALSRLSGITLRFILYQGRNDELRRDSAWQLDFSQARPDELTLYINLNDPGLDVEKAKLPPSVRGALNPPTPTNHR